LSTSHQQLRLRLLLLCLCSLQLGTSGPLRVVIHALQL